MIIQDTYPETAPECKFVGKIPFHYNISAQGDICSNSLEKWNPKTSSVLKLILNLNHLLYNPYNGHGLRMQCRITNETIERG